MKRFSKRQMANRFGYSPFIRLLLFNVRFRVFVIGVVLLLIMGLLVVPRMWDVSPPGSDQVFRINVIDMVQAWNLGRTALSLDKAGNHEGALQSWGAAIANYPTKPGLSRGYLRTALRLPGDAKLVQSAGRQAEVLLRLTHTNQADVELVARVYDKFHLPQMTVALLRSQTNAPKPELQVMWARALYDVGAYKEFEAQWRTNESTLATDPELALKRASVRDLFGNEEEAQAARMQIEQAALVGTNRVVANRLLLRSAEKRKDAGTAQRALNTLVGLKSDTPADHAMLWRVLIAADRKAEAGALIQAYNRQPVTVAEAAETYDLALAAGQTRRADDLVDWSLANQGFTTAMCSRKAAALARNEAWADLRQLAVEIRLRPGGSSTLQAFSHFIEGQASLGEGMTDQAQREFTRLGEFDYDDPGFALAMANSLIEIGQPAAALPLLSTLEGKLDSRPEYWFTYGKAAFAEKNSVLLLRATEESYALDTNNALAANNYAAALVMQRSEPILALQLTSNLVQQFPGSPIPTINHAAALLLNSRVAEARKYLGQLDPGKLSPSESNEFNFVSFNAAILAREREAATELLTKINTKQLFPPQATWLQAAARSYLQITNSAQERR